MTQTRYTQAAQLFALDTARHTMTVRHDDGLYRHLSFRAPDTNIYWFDLVTWPGCLAFHGDMGTYVFSRTADMLSFFDTAGDINPGYWGEKVQGNGDSRARGVTDYSPDRAREHVTEAFTAWADEHGWPLAATADLWEEIDRYVLDNIVEDEHEFRSAVEEFYWSGHPDHFRFRDTWDWDLAEFKHAFLYACFAVRHGVNQYRAHKIAEGDPEAVPVFPALATPPVPRTRQQLADASARARSLPQRARPILTRPVSPPSGSARVATVAPKEKYL